MTRELISKRTRNEYREFLVGWTLRDIESEFEAANVACDRNFEPQVAGQRRAFVEQHYHTLDFTLAADVRRLLAAYQGILERAEKNLPSTYGRGDVERTLANLKVALGREGFRA